MLPEAILEDPATPAQRRSRRRSRWPPVLRVAAALVVLLLIVGLVSKVISPPAGKVAEARGYTRTPEEALVKKFILEKADDPNSIEFAKWGPHDLDGSLFPEEQRSGGRVVFQIVRVCYRAKNRLGAKQLYDRLFFLLNGAVLDQKDNSYGDEWKGFMKQKIGGLVGLATRWCCNRGVSPALSSRDH